MSLMRFKRHYQGFTLVITVLLTIFGSLFQFSIPALISETYEDDAPSIVDIQEVYQLQDHRPGDSKEHLSTTQPRFFRTTSPQSIPANFGLHLKSITKHDSIRDPPML